MTRRRAPARQRWAPAVLLGLLLSGPVRAQSATADAALALPWPLAELVDTLARSPAQASAAHTLDAERAVQRQLQAGPQEWTASLASAQRRQRSPVDERTAERTAEWELSLERPWRSAAKTALAQTLGEQRVALAQAGAQRTLREQGRLLLQHSHSWLREQAAAQAGAAQVAVLARQRDATQRRLRLGDAAAVDLLQAEAALTQARAQADGAAQRAEQAAGLLQALFPGLRLDALNNPAPLPALPPAPDAEATRALIERQLAHQPELAAAAGERDLALAQWRVDEAEQRPDPTVGVRVGTARNGAEQVLGLTLSLPWGGESRRAGAQAAAARASAAGQALAQAQRLAQAEAQARVQALRSLVSLAGTQQQAAGQLLQVADQLARGYALGEGSLAEVLTARRLAHEQQLGAALAAVDARAAAWRLAWEASPPAALGGSATIATQRAIP